MSRSRVLSDQVAVHFDHHQQLERLANQKGNLLNTQAVTPDSDGESKQATQFELHGSAIADSLGRRVVRAGQPPTARKSGRQARPTSCPRPSSRGLTDWQGLAAFESGLAERLRVAATKRGFRSWRGEPAGSAAGQMTEATLAGPEGSRAAAEPPAHQRVPPAQSHWHTASPRERGTMSTPLP